MNKIFPTLTALLLAPLAALQAAEFHVAATGSDTNPGTERQPFATLERARDAVREALPRTGTTNSPSRLAYLPHKRRDREGIM